MERGYPLELVDENLMRGAALDREDLLRPKFYPSQATPAVLSKPKFVPTFIITFNPHNPPLKDWLNETFLILQANSKMKKIYDRPPSVTFRQARNLKQVLVRSRLRELPFSNCSDVPEPGCWKFNHGNRGRGCLLYPKLNVSNRLKVLLLDSLTTSGTTSTARPAMLSTWLRARPALPSMWARLLRPCTRGTLATGGRWRIGAHHWEDISASVGMKISVFKL